MIYDIDRIGVDVDYLDRAIGGDADAIAGAFYWLEMPQCDDFWVDQLDGKTPLDIDALKDIKRQYMRHTGKAGKLKDLHVKAGDVVLSAACGFEYTVKERRPGVMALWSGRWGGSWFVDVDISVHDYTLISLADAQPAAQPAAPKTWGEMTDAEKGALLLAAHEGKVIEFRNDEDTPEWKKAAPKWASWCYYRVKPEPVRETVGLYISDPCSNGSYIQIGTIDTEDGKPDCNSVKMERITKEESK